MPMTENLTSSAETVARHAASLGNPIIDMRGVSKWFGEFRALDDVHLQVAAGEKVVICGPSGSGKSTLIRCIARLEKHEQGDIVVDGVTLSDDRASVQQLRREVGMVFQQFNLFPHLSVLDNLMLAPMKARGMPKADTQALAMQYLERVGIAAQAGKFPSQLSGGQQQRVAIARSLCMRPKIMLFDEPTSALDPEMIMEVLQVMEDLAKDGMTMICVTHEMGFARRAADKVIFMDHGRIVESAAPETFFSAPQTARCQEFLGRILHH
jgi:general L-amino acid transport system ATP-binding protein